VCRSCRRRTRFPASQRRLAHALTLGFAGIAARCKGAGGAQRELAQCGQRTARLLPAAAWWWAGVKAQLYVRPRCCWPACVRACVRACVSACDNTQAEAHPTQCPARLPCIAKQAHSPPPLQCPESMPQQTAPTQAAHCCWAGLWFLAPLPLPLPLPRSGGRDQHFQVGSWKACDKAAM
jgi:hypothetical protein